MAGVADDDGVSFSIDVEMGPTLRTALDVLELVRDTVDLIPEWHTAERDELRARTQALIDTIERHLKP